MTAESILYFGWFLLNAVFVPLIQVCFFNYVQTPRFKRFVFPLVLMPPIFIAFVLVFLELISRPALVLFSNVLLFILVMTLFKDSVIQKLVNILVYFFVGSLIDIAAYPVGVSFASILSENGGLFVSTLVFVLTFALSIAFVANFLNRIKSRTIDKKGYLFLLIPFSHLITFHITALYDSRNSAYPNPSGDLLKGSITFSVASLLCLFFSLIIDIFAFRQYTKSLDAATLKSENESLAYRNKLNEQYFEDLKENELELRKVKHDIGGSLQIVKELIYEEKDVDKAKGLFDALSQTVQSINTGFYCRNSLINAILTNKAKQSKKEIIDFEADVSVPDVSPIDESDLCRILVNILDNAIEANAGLQRERFVRVRIKTSETYLFIRTENPSDGQGFSQSTKSDKTGHGYGLRILNDFSKKYDGAFTIGEKDCVTTAQITLRIQKQDTP